MNRIIITGTTGQVGYFVAKEALERGMKVIAPVRYTASGLDKKFEEREDIYKHDNFHVVTADLIDSASIDNIVKDVGPDYFVNCAAMSHVGESWNIPVSTADITGVGPVRCLDALRKFKKDCKFVQCSTSEMFGKNISGKINEETPLKAMSPYGAAKIYAHEMVRIYRESYNMSCSCVIMFNNFSRLRTKTFFTRKCTSKMAEVLSGEIDNIQFGNLNFCRDWGYSGDYAKAIHLMLTSDNKDDYVVATGEKHTGKEFIDLAFRFGNDYLELKNVDFRFDFEQHIKTNTSEFMRPNDLTYLVGDSSKIRSKLGWKPVVSFETLVKDMVYYDLGKVFQ